MPRLVLLGVVNEKTLVELGWSSLCAELANRARTPMGKERCRSLVPGDSGEEAARRLARVEEARDLRRLDREVPLADALDMRSALGRAAREGTLEPPELLAIARLIRAAVSARRFCLAMKERVPLHAELAQTLSDFEPLAQELERAFDPAGKLLDTASPLLAELRERSRGLHRGIKARLEEMLKDEEIVGMLREAYYSVRGDRYVVPLRAEHKAHLPGTVHNASGSGQTLFVEPQELVELGNQLTIADASALEEEQRILGELSGAVGRRAEALARDIETLATLDEALAGARLADDLRASLPKLGNATTETFRLSGARHPLLVLQMNARGKGGSVVANDVEIPPPARALVISGPNAGGKTVTITAVGLSALMARAGLPVAAAEGSRMPLYRTVYTAIGDEGDLSRDLSTFTAHLTALRHILEAAGPGTLVLIDEIAADTDPREGAAIASASLEKLVAAGAQVLITTHLEELKALALTDARFASASVGFDVDRLAPTYQLRMGEVGRSSAIEIAARVGLPADVCARAKEILGGGSSALSSALERLEGERAAAARARAEVEALRKSLAEERAAVQAEVAALREAEREVRAGARAELVEDLARTRQQIAEMVAQLQAAPALARAVEAQQRIARVEADEEREAAREQVRAEEAEAPPAAGIRAGVAVRHARLGVEGIVVDADDDSDQVLVQMGALRTKVAREDLVPLSRKAKSTAPGFRKSAREKLARAEAARAAPATTAVRPLDVRGMRVDEALRALEEELDRRLREGAEEVQVLHGHGSGALKAAIREHLARSPYVRRARAGASHEGGDGVTVAELRG
ncbi:MAG: endonuclease MutS2 [Myxococcales bacterium]